MTGVLMMYTIYEWPADMPDTPFVVRAFIAQAGHIEMGPIVGSGQTLAEARALVPAGADAAITRSPQDPPNVVETWF